MEDLFSIRGKVALVTGGSRGIGAMIARGFVEGGARTYITARKEAELTATADALSASGECVPVVADLATLDGCKALAAEVAAREDRLDILVNNAGATWGAPIEQFPEAGWDKVMDLNVKAMFFLTQQLLPQLAMAASPDDPARVINLSSANALRYSHMDNFSYSASKTAVLALTQHLSATLAQRHINVNAIAPGLFPSNMTGFLMEDETTRASVEGAIPMRRFGRAEDAAGTAIYLASRASSYMSGAYLVLDGGVVASA
jgi:NAD(P)-dependent dehydrogenase (short-subunit alcohol dehydrogenase family)